MCSAEKHFPLLRLANSIQGTSSLVSPFPLAVLPKAQTDHWCLGVCAQPRRSCQLSLERRKPTGRGNLHRDIKPGSRAVLYPVFRPSLTKAKVGMIWFLIVGGKVKVCKNPPNQKIKVKQGLSRVITP